MRPSTEHYTEHRIQYARDTRFLEYNSTQMDLALASRMVENVSSVKNADHDEEIHECILERYAWTLEETLNIVCLSRTFIVDVGIFQRQKKYLD